MGENQPEYWTTGLRVPWHIFVRDLIVGLFNAVVTRSGGIANGVLAGVNPVYGLYAIMIVNPGGNKPRVTSRGRPPDFGRGIYAIVYWAHPSLSFFSSSVIHGR